MKKTLLLVFIHGFKGGDDTFGNFPEHLRALVSHALPSIDVASVTYPQFETRGDLKGCVAGFREWLQNKVIDIEVANETPSPTVDPSVHVVLVGHSMGGIVAAETLLLIASEQPLPPPSSLGADSTHSTFGSDPSASGTTGPNSFMFPHIQGLLAFDTPFLGISPGVVSHSAEGHYKTAATAYGTLSEVAGVFGWGGNKKDDAKDSSATTNNDKPLALPPANDGAPTSSTDAAATPSWQRWGRYAMFASAAGAVAAGGAAALYSQRDRFSAGWSWATSHLEFVGCLARPEELRQRVAGLSTLNRERGIGCADFYTCLGKGARGTATGSQDNYNNYTATLGQSVLRSKNRTFCNLPADIVVEKTKGGEKEGTTDADAAVAASSGLKWIMALNEKAPEETTAHMGMFSPSENSAFYGLLHESSEVLVRWVDKGWYSTASTESQEKGKNDGDDDGKGDSEQKQECKSENGKGNDNGFMDADDVVVVD